MGKQASGATWNQFPQVLGEPRVLWLSLQEWGPLTAPLFAAVPGCETCCLRPWGSGYLSSHCHHSCPHYLSAQCPFSTHFFLGHAVSFTALTICDWPTLPSTHHLPPVCSLQLPAGLRCGLQATDPSLQPRTTLVISSVCHELAACKCEQMDSF